MYRENRVAVVVPAYNEARQITRVVESMPEFVDTIVIELNRFAIIRPH